MGMRASYKFAVGGESAGLTPARKKLGMGVGDASVRLDRSVYRAISS